VSLGDALAGFGKKVLLVDGNFSSPNLGLHLNIIEPEKTIHHVLERKANPSEAVYEHGNFDVMPASVFGDFNISPLKLKDKLGYLKRKYDIILLDSSPALNDETLAVMLASDDILVVTTPDLPTLSATLKAVKLAKQRGTPIVGLVMNKVYGKDFELSPSEVEDTARVPIMASIPYDVNVLKALAQFSPYSSHKPRSTGSDEYKRLAASLIGEKYKPLKLRRFFRVINPKKQDINRTIYYKEMFG
jgi:septum site-determining protein MinD